MYIDKPLKGHNLMQAIARINRVYFEKTGGLIVDYLGLANELKEALSFYSQSGGRGEITVDQEQALGVFLTKLEIVEQILADCDYQDYFTATTGEKLNILKAATDYVAHPSRKTRFQDAVTALSKAYSLAVPNAHYHVPLLTSPLPDLLANLRQVLLSFSDDCSPLTLNYD
ncbi:DUF3387 domain-containing protein [Spirulina sp. CS-785/01]|nr:type I restriction enzyme endonuclease domain-containing protein [Spirulina sp. CS-785/01]MDB9313823.1 DUF3387 domain-containing protein [Spirulina sp. CS-785/01]